MKLALRTTPIPQWDFRTAATAASESGFDGVELAASFDASSPASTNVFCSDPKKIKAIFGDAGVVVASLSHSMGDRTDELARVIQTASDLGASLVRVLRADAAAETRRFDAFAAKVVPLADTAAAAGVTLLLENEPIPGSVSRLWRVMDEANHPSVACCWSADNGRLARELPLVSIPMLNSRIRMVRFGDVSGPEIPKKKILQRLAGIGFAGWVLVDRESEDQVRGAHAGLRSALISLKSAVRTGHIKA